MRSTVRRGWITHFHPLVFQKRPFIPNNVSIIEYYRYFQVLQHHSSNKWLFAQNVVFTGMCVVPLFLMYTFFTPRLPRAFNWFATTLVLCMTMVTFLAAISGAGPHHLLPFLPAVVWGFAVMHREVSLSLRDLRARGRYEGLWLGVIAAFLFGYGPIAITSWGTVLNRFADTPFVTQGIVEINRALDKNPGLTVAVGPGGGSFDAHRLRVLPVFRGNPLPIDSTAWLDLEADGISNKVIRRAIQECRVDLWLLPSNAPFVTISHYHGGNIYSKEVLADFHATYEKQLQVGYSTDGDASGTTALPKTWADSQTAARDAQSLIAIRQLIQVLSTVWRHNELLPIIPLPPLLDSKPDRCGRAGHQQRRLLFQYLPSLRCRDHQRRMVCKWHTSVGQWQGNEWKLLSRPRRSSGRRWTAALGHKERFLPPRLSGGYGLG